MKDIDSKVEFIELYLRKIDCIIRKEGRQILVDINITVPQFTALQILINNGSLTIGELSQHMSLACSTLTDLIDRMEKSLLVERKRDKKDKRVVIVTVLPKGYEVLEEVLNKRREYLKGMLENFSLMDMENLNKSLEKLYTDMEKKS